MSFYFSSINSRHLAQCTARSSINGAESKNHSLQRAEQEEQRIQDGEEVLSSAQFRHLTVLCHQARHYFSRTQMSVCKILYEYLDYWDLRVAVEL